MHIVIVSPSFFPLRGGTEQTVFEWAQRLSLRHDVCIVTLHAQGAANSETLPCGVRVVRIRRRPIWLVGMLILAFNVFRALNAINKHKRIDIIHQGHMFYMGLGTTLFKKVKGCPMVTTLLGWDTYDPLEPVKAIYTPYLAWVMNGSDAVTAMSRHIADTAKSQGCRLPIKIVPHGSTLHNSPATLSIRNKYSIAPSARICFSLQRLHHRKGLRYLLDAVPAIIREEPETIFIIGGTGHLEQELKSTSARLGLDRNVIFAGFISDEELASHYEQSDLFVLPTLYEAFGIVYADALARGLPIVTTAVGGALDLVTGECGVLVPPADADALARAVVSAIRHPWDREAIRNRGRTYNWDSIVESYELIYETIRRDRKQVG